MTKKILVNYDFGNLESFKFRLQNLATDPTGSEGSLYMNSVAHKLMYHNGTAFVDPTARAQHTGTQTASTISDLATVVKAYRLDEFALPTASVNVNSQKITNLLPGTLGTDAINLNQLNAVKNNTDWKDSVRAATTANITLSGLQTVDGISLTAGQRVLVKDQTDGTQNGFYLAASGAWTRTADAADGTTLSSSASVFVEEGSTWAGTQWRVSNTGTITVGSTAITFTQFGAGSSYSEGNGIDITGNVISVDTAVVARKFSISIGDGSATSIAVTHSLGTKDVSVTIRDNSDDSHVEADIVSSSTTQVTLGFAVAPTSNQYRVTVIG
jgi:hypothetical protein